MLKNFLPLFLAAFFLAGCASITNLTAGKQDRNRTGLYPIEAAWQTRQQALLPESLKPQVLIGFDSYPMQPTPLVSNRWETLVPVPADKKAIQYRFKFDYEVYGVPVRRANSKMSPEYRLEIVDK